MKLATKNKTIDDPVMRAVRQAFEESKMSLDQLGIKMGYKGDMARKAAWQFLNKTADPRFSMVRRFAKAIGVTLIDLIDKS
jgi:transcriptional regulator with XRE-family HTH domain